MRWPLALHHLTLNTKTQEIQNLSPKRRSEAKSLTPKFRQPILLEAKVMILDPKKGPTMFLENSHFLPFLPFLGYEKLAPPPKRREELSEQTLLSVAAMKFWKQQNAPPNSQKTRFYSETRTGFWLRSRGQKWKFGPKIWTWTPSSPQQQRKARFHILGVKFLKTPKLSAGIFV